MKNLITCLVVCVMSGVTFAATLTVDDDGLDFPKPDYDNIQEAVDAANAGDVIIVYPGTYTVTGEEVAVVDMSGKNITLRAYGSPEETIIDGGYDPAIGDGYKGIICDSGESQNTIIQGFKITNCGGTKQANHYEGGGIKCHQLSSPQIIGCLITNNTAMYGAGISIRYDSNPTITQCIIRDNQSTISGGGVCVESESSPTFQHCEITNNIAKGSGGGIFIHYTSFDPLLINTVVCGNTPNQIVGDVSNKSNYCDNDDCSNCDYYGACCLSVGCLMKTQSECENNGGFFEGQTVLCSDETCFLWGVGACCTNNICVDSFEDACNTFGGQWLGNGIICKNSDCTPTCAADLDGDGVVNVTDLLALISVWGVCP